MTHSSHSIMSSCWWPEKSAHIVPASSLPSLLVLCRFFKDVKLGGRPSWSCSGSVPKDGLLRGTRWNCIEGRRGPANLTATPLPTRPILGPMSHTAIYHTLTDSCDFSKEIRRHSPSLILWSVFMTSLASLAFVGLVRNSYRNIGEVGKSGQYSGRSIFAPKG
jgi:hypothetical protein